MADQAAEPKIHDFPIGPEPEEGAADERRTITMREPSEGQVLVLTRLIDLSEEEPLESIQLFADAVEQMMVEREDVKWLHRALLRNTVTPNDLAEMASAALVHFLGAEMNRAERRSTAGRKRASRARTR